MLNSTSIVLDDSRTDSSENSCFQKPKRAKKRATRFSRKDGQIYIRSNKRDHQTGFLLKLGELCQRLNGFLCRVCCGCKVSEAFAEEEKVGESPRYRSQSEKLHEMWNNLYRKESNKVGLKEVKILLKKLNASVPQREVLFWLQNYDKDNDQKVDFEEFKKMYFSLRSVPDLREEFVRAKLHEANDDQIVEKMGITFSPKWQWAKQQFLVAEDLAWFFKWASNGDDQPTVAECEALIRSYTQSSTPQSPPPKRTRSQLLEIFNGITEHGSEKQNVAKDICWRLSYESFVEMITDLKLNAVLDPLKTKRVFQDMNQPLSHYFISSSHNTYLVGNQINSDSSPQAVERVLKLGVRVIELDCWDGNDGQPIVTHGHTLCKPTSFESCIVAVNQFAFYASEYPLILTLENHCSRKQQKKQVKIMKQIFKEKLFLWSIEDFLDANKCTLEDDLADEVLSGVGPATFLSPNELKYKIVLRQRPVKKMTRKEKVDLQGKVRKLQSFSTSASSSGPKWNLLKTKSQELELMEERKRSLSLNSNSSNDYDERTVKATLKKQKTKEKEESKSSKGVHRSLLRLLYLKNINLPLPKAKEKIEDGLKAASADARKKKDSRLLLLTEPDFASSSSFNENDMKRLVAPGRNSATMNTYAKHHLLRVYPAVTRINSSNFNPVPAWNAGCQIVALNYQSLKFKVWLNHGKFLVNKGCGYVLKPKEMLQAADIGVVFSAKRNNGLTRVNLTHLPKWNLDLNEMSPRTLKVRILSAHYLPKKADSSAGMINPFVELKLRGLHKEDFKTKWVESNGFNPRWHETFTFKVFHPELCLLGLIVKSKEKTGEGSFVAQRVLPVSAIRPGFRTISLLFKNCTHIDSAHLVCRIWWENIENRIVAV